MKQRPYTLLAVQAHHDDECSGTAGLLRLAADAGHRTVLVTCTNGELGEVKGTGVKLDPRNNPGDRKYLLQVRYRELEQAARLLRISHLHRLGYQDSGMLAWETNDEPQAFVNADPYKVIGRLVEIIRRYRPEIVITYDDQGGYGHPDHVMAHRMTVAALQTAADPEQFPATGQAWRVVKFYYTAWARSEMLRA
ncbi:MAG: PIG-L family deacetylase, partial [bacterium]|nr:PIG-L family deacetylase [bacterium]